MATSLIRSRAAITGTNDRLSWNEIKDGAVLQEDGVIVAVGTYDDLHRKHPTVPVIGNGKEILLPGFVNGHHHVGLTPVQLGSPDMPLELWFITRMVIRNLDLYLDTLYSAFEMIGSGITTVQHIQGWMPGTLPDVEKRATETIKRLRGCRHARQLLLRRARPEPARLPGRRGVREEPAEGTAGPDAALVRPLPDEPRRCDGHVQVVPFAASQQAPGEDPARARQPALVLRQGADGAVRRLVEVQRADAHASGRDRLPEGIRQAARRLHGAGVHRPLRHGERAADLGPRRVAEREGHRSAGRGQGLRLPQLLVQLPPALGRGGAELLREEGHQHRDRPRRGRHQRRPRHAAGAEARAARPSRARHGRGGRADHGAGAAHGDRRRREDDAVRHARSARSRSARRPTWC